MGGMEDIDEERIEVVPLGNREGATPGKKGAIEEL